MPSEKKEKKHENVEVPKEKRRVLFGDEEPAPSTQPEPEKPARSVMDVMREKANEKRMAEKALSEKMKTDKEVADLKKAAEEMMKKVNEREKKKEHKGKKEGKKKKKAEETKPSQPPLKEFTVTDNGVTMHLSLWREEQTCVVDVSRSGAYKSFSELYDCETSVKVKCRQSRFFVPTELLVDEEVQHTIICVAERCWTEG